MAMIHLVFGILDVNVCSVPTPTEVISRGTGTDFKASSADLASLMF